MPIMLAQPMFIHPSKETAEEMEKWLLLNSFNFYKTDKGFQVVGMGLDKISIPSNM